MPRAWVNKETWSHEWPQGERQRQETGEWNSQTAGCGQPESQTPDGCSVNLYCWDSNLCSSHGNLSIVRWAPKDRFCRPRVVWYAIDNRLLWWLRLCTCWPARHLHAPLALQKRSFGCCLPSQAAVSVPCIFYARVKQIDGVLRVLGVWGVWFCSVDQYFKFWFDRSKSIPIIAAVLYEWVCIMLYTE